MGRLSPNQKLSDALVRKFGREISSYGFVPCPSEYKECFFREVSKEIIQVVIMGRFIRDNLEYRPVFNITHHSLNQLYCEVCSRPDPDRFMFDTVRTSIHSSMPHKEFKHYDFNATTPRKNDRMFKILTQDFKKYGIRIFNKLTTLQGIAHALSTLKRVKSSHVPFITILAFLMLRDKRSMEREIRKAKSDLKTLEWDTKEEAEELDDFIRKVRKMQKKLWK